MLLLCFTTLLDFFCGLRIHRSDNLRSKRLFLLISVVGNLIVLGFFKYHNFFIETFQGLLVPLGIKFSSLELQWVLPLGISFYTFKSLSYTIDIYRGQLSPTQSFLDYGIFVAFFPQLTAGPIERAAHFLPQLSRPRVINREKIVQGAYLILWGLFLKIFVADSLTKIVDPVFISPGPYHGIIVLLASYAFTFQIFCDFAGYSQIAAGIGNLMGFEMVWNFTTPFFVTNVQEFWNKWHMSLSSWVKDYIFIPVFFCLRGMGTRWRLYLSSILTMVLLGAWHGAKWTFVAFGFYYGMLLVILALIKEASGGKFSSANSVNGLLWRAIKMLFVFHLAVFGMLLFRASSLTQAIRMGSSLLSIFSINPGSDWIYLSSKILFYIIPVLIVQYAQHRTGDMFVVLRAHWIIQALFYYFCFYLLIIYGEMGGQEFIYAQF